MFPTISSAAILKRQISLKNKFSCPENNLPLFSEKIAPEKG